MTTRPIGVAHYGLGPIGLAAAEVVARRTNLDSVAAVDADPRIVGRDLGELLGRDSVGVTVRAPDDARLDQARAVIHCTGSSLAGVAPQIRQLLDRGLSVVSSCEELSYPWIQDAEIARDLDRAARQAKVAVLGTGVNPGFAMDYLPLVLTAVTDEITSVRVHRVQDAMHRRVPLQHKIGVGLDAAGFDELAARSRIGHVGLRQSAQALAAGLGWDSARFEERLAPVVAERQVVCAAGSIEAGQVAGIHHTVTAVVDDREAVSLCLEMAVGLQNPRDEISIAGSPPIRMTVPGGLPGDQATAAILVNTVVLAVAGEPGLRVMSELSPALSARGVRR
jgi:2,4-diaminopentanoate dehydrogenase